MKRSSVTWGGLGLERWASSPLRVVAYLTLIAVVVLGGPWACLAHCLILDAVAHAHHDHALNTGSGLTDSYDPCPTELYGTGQPAGEPPNALTFAVLGMLTLVPLLCSTDFRFMPRLVDTVSVIHPPPRHPPRHSMSIL